MSNTDKVCFKNIIETYKAGIQIPEIQRDYVMGAGGKKEGTNVDKLTALLDAILDGFKLKRDFDFSCIITYCKDPNTGRLEIYDGQQRLTTLMILILVCLQRERGDYAGFKGKYRFCGRPIANAILDQLSDDGFFPEKIKVEDFTSFSMKNLIEKFSEERYKDITSDYLMNRVRFDRVELGSQSEIEQFFMDLNAGVKLKAYELYKAKLVHHIVELQKKCETKERELLEKWPYKLDNEWLDAFKTFADFNHPAEEYEIAFIQHCFVMLSAGRQSEVKKDDVKKDDDKEDDVSAITPETLVACYDIMGGISRLDFFMISNKFSEIEIKPHMVEFAWGTRDECAKIKKYYNMKLRGAYWNLGFDKNEYHLFYIIKNVLLKKDPELWNDAIVWAIITSINWETDYRNEYTRILKILLNHIFEENDEAWYECQEKGQYLYYSKYTVSAIPNYYGEHLKWKKSRDNDPQLKCIWKMIEFFRDKPIETESAHNPRIISDQIVNQMTDYLSREPKNGIRKVLDELKENRKEDAQFEKSLQRENDSNGICREKLHNYFASKVKLSWPIRGREANPREYYVLLKCRMDMAYEEYNREMSVLDSNRFGLERFIDQNRGVEEFDYEKCFWRSEAGGIDVKRAYRLCDRKSDNAETYANYGGSDTEFWAYQYKDGKRTEVKEDDPERNDFLDVWQGLLVK